MLLDLLEEKGPLTGAELLDCSGMDGLQLWRTCRTCRRLVIRRISSRYLRLDRRIPGYARLSPSILREFLTYSVIGLNSAEEAVDKRAGEISARIRTITAEKAALAYRVVSSLANRFLDPSRILEGSCFILAGDIVYNMAHDVPRPERSTGRLVQGSDLDLVVVVDDQFPAGLRERLDELIFQEKYRLLTAPHVREEIDYVVKDMQKVAHQLQFDTFRHMVACKILQEGAFLYGSEVLFSCIKELLRNSGAAARLAEMEGRARRFRRRSEKILMEEELEVIRHAHLDLFYPTDESEEFE
jgi:hypothetical protein